MAKCLFLLLWILVCGELAEARKNNGCPTDFFRVSGRCYYFSERAETWHEAHFECRDRSANLAVVHKKWQDKNLRFYLNHSKHAKLVRWIGGIYNWKAMIWVWGPTGKALRYRGFPKKQEAADYRWKCTSMDPAIKYRWKPRSCVERLHYICEAPLKKKPKKLVEE